MEKKTNWVGYIYLVITFLIWGSNYVVSRFIVSSIPAPAVTGCRSLIALIPLWIMAKKAMPFPKVEKGDRIYFLIVGFLGYYFMLNINTVGIQLTNASTAAAINGLTPVAITLIAAVVLKEKLDGVKILCLALALAATFVVSTGSVAIHPLGIAILLFGLCCWGLTTVVMRKLMQKYPSIMVTVYAVTIAAVFHIPTVIITGIANGGIAFTAPALLSMAYLGLVVTGVGHFLWGKSLSVFEATFCSMFYPLQSIFALILGAIFLKEKVTLSFYIGLAFVGADVIIMCLHNKRTESIRNKQ